MKKEVVILIAEDDEGHAALIKKNLKRAGISNEIVHFKDGVEALDFLMGSNGGGPHRKPNVAYMLLLDIRMPKVDGVEVLRQVKGHERIAQDAGDHDHHHRRPARGGKLPHLGLQQLHYQAH